MSSVSVSSYRASLDFFKLDQKYQTNEAENILLGRIALQESERGRARDQALEKWWSAVLREYFQGSKQVFEDYFDQARRVGKSKTQRGLFKELLKSVLPKKLPGQHLGNVLVRLGLFDEASYNACSPLLLALICQKDVLLFSFTRPKALLARADIKIRGELMYTHKHFDYYHLSKQKYESQLKITELDRVLIHFGRQIGKEGFWKLWQAQFDYDGVCNKDMFENPRGSLLEDKTYTPKDTQNHSRIIGRLMLRFMSEAQLRAADVHEDSPLDTEDIIDGALYPLAFPEPEKKSCSIM
ncbi:hypothetical protein [Chitinimonas arctica]|nr:hypothetical protein [Chitinimonas arctica]